MATKNQAAFFSVIIPLYNKEHYVQAVLLTACTQSFTNFEIIIINDGSIDNSLEMAESVEDARIKIYTTKNQGVSAARNYGMTKATTSYIVFLDADDSWKPNHLENLHKLITSFPNCGLYATAYAKQHKHIAVPSIYKNIPKGNSWSGIVKDYFESSTVNSIAWTSAVCVPKTILNTIGGFDETITLGAGEDTDLWIRIALEYPIAFNNEVTAIHNLATENRISKSNTNLRHFINLDRYETRAKSNASLKKYLDLNRFSIGLQYKIAGNTKKSNDYWGKLDKTNLNKKQILLMTCHRYTLLLLIYMQNSLRRFGVNTTPF